MREAGNHPSADQHHQGYDRGDAEAAPISGGPRDMRLDVKDDIGDKQQADKNKNF